MKHLELVLLAGLAAGIAGCVATIDASAVAGDTRGSVTTTAVEDDAGTAGADSPDVWKMPKPRAEAAGPVPPKPRSDAAGSAAPNPPPEAAGSAAPKPVAAAPDASSPPTPPRQMDAGMPPPMAAMPAAGSLSSPPMDAGPACDFRGLVQAKCGSAGCHGGPSASTGLDLTSPSLAMRVAGRKGPSACASRLLIDTENPSQSALYLKVAGTSCGSQMPLGGTLTPSEQACFLSWIEAL